jgi:gluconate kinase
MSVAEFAGKTLLEIAQDWKQKPETIAKVEIAAQNNPELKIFGAKLQSQIDKLHRPEDKEAAIKIAFDKASPQLQKNLRELGQQLAA